MYLPGKPGRYFNGEKYNMTAKKTTPDHVWKNFIAIDVSGKTRDFFNGRITLSYLSWTHAIHILMEEYPSAEWGFDPNEMHPDGSVTVHSWVRIGDITRRMQLPVMNKKKNAELNPDARVINDNKMRCLTKNLAVWGLGLQVFHGEDFPDDDDDDDDDEKNNVKEGRAKEEPQKTTVKTVKKEVKKPEEEVDDDFSVFDDDDESPETEQKIPDFDEEDGDVSANTETLEITDNKGNPVRFSKQGDNDFSLIIEQFLKFAKVKDTAESLKDYWITNGNLVLQIKRENPGQFSEMRTEFSKYGKNLK